MRHAAPDRRWAWSDAALAAGLGLVPVAVVLLRISFLARFDSATTLALLAATNTVSVAMATFVPLVPLALFYAGVLAVLRRRQLPPVAAQSAIIGTLLVAATLIAFQDALTVGLLSLTAVLMVAADWLERNRLGFPPTLAFMMAGALGTVTVTTLASTDNAWVPQEALVLRAESDPTEGYVVQVTGEWTTILLEEERRIRIVRTRDVLSRAICREETSVQRSVAQMALREGPEASYERC